MYLFSYFRMWESVVKWRPQLPQLAQLMLCVLLLLPHVAPICYDQSPFWFVSQAGADSAAPFNKFKLNIARVLQSRNYLFSFFWLWLQVHFQPSIAILKYTITVVISFFHPGSLQKI